MNGFIPSAFCISDFPGRTETLVPALSSAQTETKCSPKRVFLSFGLYLSLPFKPAFFPVIASVYLHWKQTTRYNEIVNK